MKRIFKKSCMLLVAVIIVVGCSAQVEETEIATTQMETQLNVPSNTIAEKEVEDTLNIAMGVESGVMYDFDHSPIIDFPTVDYNTEEYNSFEENAFSSVYNNPLSTFGADVDSASYTNVRRMINEGILPTTDAVRVEEMVNFFDYDYIEPSEEEIFNIYTEVNPCEWNQDTQLLSIVLNTQSIEKEQLPPSNLVFLIDVSGSMDSYDKLPLVQEAFSLLIENLTSNDVISIVTYAGNETIVLEGASGDDKQQISDAINDLTSGGSTHGSKAIQTAYEIAQEHFIDGGNNRIILATDGDLNVGLTSESDLKNLVEEQRENGVFLSVLGFGDGNYKDNKMETLSQNGNGNYYYIDTKIEAQRVLVEEMGSTLHTVAKDVKIQVEFNPSAIKGYRLIGYENRLLDEEDFSDDTKDAGEIGAGHQMVALYEVIPSDSAIEVTGSNLKYQETTPIDSNEWLTVSVRYKEPEEDESKLITKVVTEKEYSESMSDNVKLMSAVVEFGMLLRDSSFVGTANYDDLLTKIKALDRFTEDDYIIEFYTIVKKASEL